MKKNIAWKPILSTVFVLVLVASVPAHAALTGGSGLPMETTLQKLTTFATGPLAYAMIILGLVGLAWKWHQGGEFGGALAGMGMIAVVGAILANVPNFITTFLGSSTLLH